MPLMMIAALFYVVIYTMPLLNVFTNIALNWRTVLAPFEGRVGKALLIFTVPGFIIGCAIFFFPFFELLSNLLNIFIFLLIDVIRQSGSMLPKVIFIIGVIVYVRQSFVDFNDQYRDFKMEIFSVARDMKGTRRVMKDNGLPLLMEGGPFPYEQAIPYTAYQYVCDVIQPHRSNIARTIVRLVASLFCISVFFAIIIEYQVFDSVTKTSEAFLSVVTVSLPRVIGLMKTEGYQELKNMRQRYAIEALLTEITEEQEGDEKNLDKEKNGLLNLQEADENAN
jgi:hypothetical protein